jgi:hypothetical protein
MGRHAQPVPPIFQPEVAAEAIVYAAYAQRREIYVGGSTVKAILANRFVPGLLDRYLARDYAGQLSGEPADAARPDNLFAAAPGRHGAHGRFDHIARGHSLELWASLHRGWLLAGLASRPAPRRHGSAAAADEAFLPRAESSPAP